MEYKGRSVGWVGVEIVSGVTRGGPTVEMAFGEALEEVRLCPGGVGQNLADRGRVQARAGSALARGEGRGRTW